MSTRHHAPISIRLITSALLGTLVMFVGGGCGGRAESPDGGAETSEPPTPEPPAPDPATDAGADATTDAAPGTCNAVTQLGEAVVFGQSKEPPPIARGGPIANGTYVLTSVTEHTQVGSAVPTLKKTVEIRDGTFFQVTEINGESPHRVNSAFAVAGTTITFTPVCWPEGEEPAPPDGLEPPTYTATATTFELIAELAPGVVGHYTFTKR